MLIAVLNPLCRVIIHHKGFHGSELERSFYVVRTGTSYYFGSKRIRLTHQYDSSHLMVGNSSKEDTGYPQYLRLLVPTSTLLYDQIYANPAVYLSYLSPSRARQHFTRTIPFRCWHVLTCADMCWHVLTCAYNDRTPP